MRQATAAMRSQGSGFRTDGLIVLNSRIIPKLADADSSCVSPIRTSIAKTYVGPMGYGARAQAQTLANMSQYFRSLVLERKTQRFQMTILLVALPRGLEPLCSP